MRIRLRHVFATLTTVLLLALAALAITLSYTEECGPATSTQPTEGGFTAVIYRCSGSPDIMEFATLEKPVPASNEILVRVKAAAVNPLDWHYLRGEPYFMRLNSGIGVPDDNRLGVDFAGVVEAVHPLLGQLLHFLLQISGGLFTIQVIELVGIVAPVVQGLNEFVA